MPLQKSTSNQNNNNSNNNNNNPQPYTWGFFLSPTFQGEKIDNLAEKKLCCLDSPHCVFECERVEKISFDANPFAPGSSHGDSSYNGYCMLSVSVSSVCNSPGECVCVCLYCICMCLTASLGGFAGRLVVIV